MRKPFIRSSRWSNFLPAMDSLPLSGLSDSTHYQMEVIIAIETLHKLTT